MKKILAIVMSMVLCTALYGAAESIELKSPQGKVKAVFHFDPEGHVEYSMQRDGEDVVLRSQAGIVIDQVNLGDKATKQKVETYTVDETYPWRGVHSVAVNKCNGWKFTMLTGKQQWFLEVRCYDDGLAFRYLVPGDGHREVTKESTTFTLPLDFKVRRLTVGRGEETRVGGGVTNKITGSIAPPFVFYSEENKRFNVLLEGGGFTYHGIAMNGMGKNTMGCRFFGNKGKLISGPIESSWRIVGSYDDLNGLVNSDLVHNVCPAPDPVLFPKGLHTEWIKPGKSVWNWWAKLSVKKIGGVHNLIHNAKQLNCEYALLDYGWEERNRRQIGAICRYAKKRGVGIFVWKPSEISMAMLNTDKNDPNNLPPAEQGKMSAKQANYKRSIVSGERNRRRAGLKALADAGVKGIKLDYIDSENAHWKRYMIEVLKDCAEFKLMVVFHGCPIPAGESRTYPNEVSREAIYGLEKIRGGGGAAKMPSSLYINMIFTRLLAGHADFTPICLAPYNSKGYTQTMQVASSIAFTSPLLIMAENPKVIRSCPAAPIIRSMPSEWDETIVLPGSQFNKLLVMARRKGDDWYVAMINGFSKENQSYKLPLNFLGDGEYDVLMCKDIPGSAKVETENVTLKANESIDVVMNPTGGFIARFTPKKSEQEAEGTH